LREGWDRGEWPGAESNCRHADFQLPPRAAPSSLTRANKRNDGRFARDEY